MPEPPVVIAQRYELHEVIGQGGCGIVYRATDRQSREPVAIKVLSHAAADPSMVERLVREQQIMLALAGTSAVRVIDLCESSVGSLCLVMEWLDGMDLEHHLDEVERSGQRLSIERLIEIIAPVVETLQRAHSMDIVHRDLKPANIFLVSGPQRGTRLLDFGLSRMKSSTTLTGVGTVMGSPSYIAPEAWRGDQKLVDHRCDLYSLAVIIFRILTGEVPFPTADWLKKRDLVTTAKRPSLHAFRPDLPREIDEWAQQALSIDPARRFNTARGMFTAFLLSLGKTPTEIEAWVGPEISGSERRNALFVASDAAKSLLARLGGRRREPSSPPEATTAPPPPVLSSIPELGKVLEARGDEIAVEVPRAPRGSRPGPFGPMTLSRIPEIEAEMLPADEASSPPTLAYPEAPASAPPDPASNGQAEEGALKRRPSPPPRRENQ